MSQIAIQNQSENFETDRLGKTRDLPFGIMKKAN